MKGRAALAGALVLVLLAACGGEMPVEETAPAPSVSPVQTLTLTLPCYAGASLHPITGESRTNLDLAGLMYESLFVLDEAFEVRGELARSWTVSGDGLLWSIRLEERWFSDGSPLTAEDVVYSLDLARGSTLYSARLADVTVVEAAEGEVRIRLRTPNAALPALLDIPVVRRGEEGDGPPGGTGRYVYEQGEEGPRLKRRAGSAQSLPEVIALAQVQNAEELIYAFDTKEITLLGTDLTGSHALGFSGEYEAWDYSTTSMVYLGFQTKSGACADPVLRRAVALALDRESVVSALYAQHARASALPVHPDSGLYDPDIAQSLAYAPQEGESLLAQGGYTWWEGALYRRGKPIRLTLLVNTGNPFRLSVAEYLARELGKLGITVQVERLAWKDYTARLSRGEFDLYLAESQLTADFDLTGLVGSRGALNHGRWSDGETDRLLQQLREAQGAQRPAAASALYERLAQQVPIAPVCFRSHTVLTQWGQVTGLTPTRGSLFAGDDWQVGAAP